MPTTFRKTTIDPTAGKESGGGEGLFRFGVKLSHVTLRHLGGVGAGDIGISFSVQTTPLPASAIHVKLSPPSGGIFPIEREMTFDEGFEDISCEPLAGPPPVGHGTLEIIVWR